MAVHAKLTWKREVLFAHSDPCRHDTAEKEAIYGCTDEDDPLALRVEGQECHGSHCADLKGLQFEHAFKNRKLWLEKFPR